MGCCTGNYLLLQGNVGSSDIVELMKRTFRFIAGFEGDVPGASPRDCGNYSFMNLADAKVQALKYLEEVLERITPEQLVYPEN